MKKTLLIILMALLAISGIWAGTDPASDGALDAVTMYNPVLSTRAKGMGGAGIAYPGRADSFVLNPAGLAGRNAFYLPGVQVDIYHPYDIIKKDADGKSVLDKFMDKSNPNAMIDGATDLISSLKAGRGKIADVNAKFGMDIKGFFMLADVTDSIHTFGRGTGGLETNLINEASVMQHIGYAHEFDFGKGGALSFGVNFRPTFKFYNQAIGADTILASMNGNEGTPDIQTILMEQLPVAAGMAYPVDLGIKYDIGMFHLGVAARNLNGTFYMKSFDNINNFTSDVGSAFTGKDFKIASPWSLDAGMSFAWENSFFRPVISADVVDIIGLAKTENLSAKDFLNHLNLGVDLRLLSFLDVRAGMASGWYSLGAGIDLWAIKLDIAYYTKEFGDTAGGYGLDALSVRFNIGWDR